MGIYTEAVQKLYVAYFNRPADAAGLTYWESALEKNGGKTADIAAAFAATKEYKDTFAGQSEYQIINTIYLNLFGRDAEPAGLQYWGQGLINKVFTIDAAVTTIAAGAQGTDGAAFQNKVKAATSFTAALDTTPEIIGYSGTAANLIAKTWLSGVTTDATLTAAITPAALNASIGVIVDNGPSSGGQSFTLTQGQDLLVGTSGNDTFNVNAFNATTGADASNMTAIDSIDGGAGKDTLNIEVKDNTLDATNLNGTLPSSIKNVEVINLNLAAADALALTAVDASKFVGATLVNQIGKATAVTNLGAGTTAGFTSQAAVALSVAAAGATAAVSLKDVNEAATVAVTGTTLTGVTVSGNLVDGIDAGTTVGALGLTVTAGDGVQTVSVNSSMATSLIVVDGATVTKKVTFVDASASTGGITFTGSAATTKIATGAGNDTVALAATTLAAATGVTAIDASVTTGAGNDTITIDTANAGLATTTGATTVDAGAGNDTVNITTRSSGKLTVSLGDGNDTFTAAVAVGAGDSIDAGAGTDTLALSLVGSANIGAFSNFDLFDTKALAKTLDVDILALKNTVTEIVASGDVGVGATLTNLGAGVNFRVTGDMAASTQTLAQKTAGALTVTVDADETAPATNVLDTVTASVAATNATSVKAVFDTAFKASVAGEGPAGDNIATLALNTSAATSLQVVSGGALAHNVLAITDSGASGKLAAIVVTGDRDLTINATGTVALASIDASASTGGLITSTNALAEGGTIKLGSGVDMITVGSGSVPATAESIIGFEKSAAIAVSVDPADATASAAAKLDADHLMFTAGVAANANAAVTTGTIAKGVLTFTGAGPSDLTAAMAIADLAAETTNEVVVFQFLGDTFVFQQGGAADLAVKLVGVTGVTSLTADAGGVFLV